LHNPALREDQRQYASDYSLMVRCGWRIEADQEVLCGWSEFDPEDGNLPGCLLDLEGEPIVSVLLTEPILDVKILFGNGRALSVFCDLGVNSGDDNYRYRTPDGLYVIGPGSELTLKMQ
jgi:hypothetical protein